MEIDPTTLVLLGVICVVLGFIASGLLGTLREDQEIEQMEENADLAPPGGRKGRYTPVARFWRDRENGRLIVEIEGKSLVSSEPLTGTQRERLESIARDFPRWLGITMPPASELPREPRAVVMATPPAHPSSAVVDTTQLASSAGTSKDVASREVISGAAAANLAPSIPQDVPYQPVPPRSAPVSARPVPGQGKGKAVPSPLEDAAAQISAKKSIAGQIEDILQDMIEGGPFDNRGIHLLDDPIKGVIVTVDGNRYEGIDSVPNPDAKALLRSAVAEWEKRQ